MISFNNVSKVYESAGQSVHAVEDVTLSVEKGEIFQQSSYLLFNVDMREKILK